VSRGPSGTGHFNASAERSARPLTRRGSPTLEIAVLKSATAFPRGKVKSTIEQFARNSPDQIKLATNKRNFKKRGRG
jgi:hypothetical protein